MKKRIKKDDNTLTTLQVSVNLHTELKVISSRKRMSLIDLTSSILTEGIKKYQEKDKAV